jgi:hypothetical protein
MHTEHLQNVRTTRVFTGWLVAIAVTSLLALAFAGTGVLGSDATSMTTVGSLIAVIVGFWAGGFFAGFRAIEAPILHGVGIGLTSLVVWAVLNIVVAVAFRGIGWTGLTPALAVGLMLAQIAAAVVGALLGYNVALRGKPGLSEHEPLPDR